MISQIHPFLQAERAQNTAPEKTVPDTYVCGMVRNVSLCEGFFHEKGFHQVLNAINSLYDASKLFLKQLPQKGLGIVSKRPSMLMAVGLSPSTHTHMHARTRIQSTAQKM